MFDNQFFAQQGWQCPICKRVYSPFTPMCGYCGGNTVITTGGTDIDWQKHRSVTTAVHNLQDDNYTSVSTGYATYTAEDIRTCDYCKHHNASEILHSPCRECINYDRWEQK